MWLQSREKLEKEVRRLSAATFRVVSSNSLLKEPECGTAFVFFNRDARTYLLTCFHVVLSASSLVEVEKKIQQDKLGAGKDGYWNFYKKYLKNVQVENAILPDFQCSTGRLLAQKSLLNSLDLQKRSHEVSNPAPRSSPRFAGFGGQVQLVVPLSFSFPLRVLHLQLNAVNLGGNSGAALFLQKTCKL